ncbi:MAG: hypothetical protein C3F02_00200 [Parcubacteria group bacterium]|nr:MAG: hypothetical protein C3F02_00200 [Parcubacteria group bacterium]
MYQLPPSDWFITAIDMQIFSNKKGFSIIELVVAIALFAILAAGVMNVAINNYRTYYGVGDKQVLMQFAQEGVEAARAIADYSWVTFKNGVGGNHGVTKTSGIWGFSGTSDRLSAFTRVVTVANVQRDSNGNIVSSNGSDDPQTKKVTVTVSGSGMQDYILTAYITDAGSRTWEQTDWSGASGKTYWHDISRTSSLSTAYSSQSNFTTSVAGQLTVAGAAAATMTSSIYTIGSAAKELRSVTVEQSLVPAACSLVITLETSQTSAFSSPASQTISDASGIKYTSSTSDSLNGQLFMRYKVDMAGCSTASTTLYSIKIKYR